MGAVIPPHVQWLKERIADGTVVQAGKWGDKGGIAIIRAGSLSEAMETLERDPLVVSGLITFDIDELNPMIEFK